MRTRMHIYLDETGYTGRDILNADQPVYALASTNLSDERARALAERLFEGNRASELKHSDLCSRIRGQEQIVSLVRALCETPGAAAVSVVHKAYALLALIVDFWVEPALRLDGINLYERGANIGLVNVAYMMLRASLTAEELSDLLGKGQAMLRLRTNEAYLEFGSAIRGAIEGHPNLADTLGFLLAADYRLGGYEYLETVPDRLTDLGTYGLLETVGYWRECAGDDELVLVHDRSSALAREQHLWDLILSSEVPPATVGQDRRTIRFPLNVREIQLADSRHHLQLQLADILAGAVAAFFRSRFNFEPLYRKDYVDRLSQVAVSDLVINVVWPTAAVTPEQMETDGPVLGDAADFIGKIVGGARRTR